MEPIEEEIEVVEIIEEPKEPETEIYEPQIIDVQFSLELRQQTVLGSMTGIVNFSHPLNMTYLADKDKFDSIFEISVLYGNGSGGVESISPGPVRWIDDQHFQFNVQLAKNISFTGEIVLSISEDNIEQDLFVLDKDIG